MGSRISLKKTVEFVREELERIAPDYQTLADCLEGERAVKGMLDNDVSSHLGVGIYARPRALYSAGNVVNASAARRYLPQPVPTDTSEENNARYDAYVTRAVFYNATSRTLSGYLGQLFQREPIVEVPDGLKVVVEDTTGERVDLEQALKEAVGYTLPFGRSGVLADYPMVPGGLTRAQRESGMIRPILRTYAPWDITNWRERQIGSARILELVVLREQYTVVGKDGFETTTHWQYRELRLDSNGEYRSRLWRQSEEGGEYTPYRDWTYATDAKGKRFNRIPFFFIGSSNNDPKIDKPPFLDIAKVNLGHYRNSADYEEACFMMGQPTVVFSGLTEEWYDEVLKGQIYLGSRTPVPLPEGGEASLIQPAPNTLPYEAMTHKEKQLVTLGARIAETPDVMRTATEATISAVETHSPLLSTAVNVSNAFRAALKICAAFEGVDADDKIKVEITSEATLQLLSTAERQQMREDFIAGLLTFDEVRHNLRRSGVAGASDDTEARAHYDETMSRLEESMNSNQETMNNESQTDQE